MIGAWVAFALIVAAAVLICFSACAAAGRYDDWSDRQRKEDKN